MKLRNLYRIVIGSLFIIAGIISAIHGGRDTAIMTILLSAGLAFLITGIVRHQRYGDDPESDERSKKLGAYGLSYAWITGLFGICLLFWVDYTGLYMVSAEQALGFSIFLLAISAAGWQAWFFRKGDVE